MMKAGAALLGALLLSTGMTSPLLAQGAQQDSDYAGLGLRPEEYAVMVIIAAHQEKLAHAARGKAA